MSLPVRNEPEVGEEVSLSMQNAMSLGQSGFHVSILQRDGRIFVRKRASTQSGALRLERQFVKHAAVLQSSSMAPLLVPEIVTPFQDGGYSMAYAPGQPMGYALEVMSQSEVARVGDKILTFIRSSMESAKTSTENERIQSKLDSLLEVYLQLSDPISRSLGIIALDRVRTSLEHVNVSTSFNHGDFSLENLISDRRGEKIYAIDFLDSPFETCLVDIGRLWLDLTTRWWAFRTAPSATGWTNLAALRTQIFMDLREMGFQVGQIEAFATLAALRVLPYTDVPYRSAILKSVLRKASETL